MSVREGDPGYSPDAYNYVAYLNGVKVNHCHTADEEKGEVHHFLLNDDGELYAEGDEIAETISKGEVSIRRSETERKGG